MVASPDAGLNHTKVSLVALAARCRSCQFDKGHNRRGALPERARHLDYERLILPLASDDKTVNMDLTGTVGFGFG